MNTILTACAIAASLFAAVLLGMWIRRLLPEHHLSPDSKDTVKLAMGLVATMAALLLGLLVSSAKGAYDAERAQVIQMAAKVAFLDRVLTYYGPEAAEARQRFLAAVDEAVQRIWPKEKGVQSSLAPAAGTAGTAVLEAIQALSPHDDTQRSLKAQAASLAMELAQLRWLLAAQSIPSISKAMLLVVVSWLVAIFVSFTILAPPNGTATLALIVSVFSVAGAIFLILELDRPFGGLIQISSEPVRFAISQANK